MSYLLAIVDKWQHPLALSSGLINDFPIHPIALSSGLINDFTFVSADIHSDKLE